MPDTTRLRETRNFSAYPPCNVEKIYEANAKIGFRNATREELHEGLTLGEKLIGKPLASEESLWKLQLHTKMTAWVYNAPITGIHLFVPLTEEGVRAVREGVFDPNRPALSQCSTPEDPCAGVYVGAYAGATKDARKAIMTGAVDIRLNCFGHVPCFASAATEDGARSMRSLGFGPTGVGGFWAQEALADIPENAG